MDDVLDLGSRRELFVDEHVVDRLGGAARRQLHQPTPREIALLADRPWEGNMCGAYGTVFQDGALYRLYYQAWHVEWDQPNMQEPRGLSVAYATSRDGVHWDRPELGLFRFRGSRQNNIVWTEEGTDNPRGVHGFAPFKDANPDCPPEQRYKALGAARRIADPKLLYALVSADGIHWSLRPEPALATGALDSQNLAFWDSLRGEYRMYLRDFQDGLRAIRTATSPDFVHWTEPVWLEYPGAPAEQLYTNQVIPYYRAPHIFLGFPARYVERPWSASIEALPELEHRRRRSQESLRYGTAVTDGLFMASRDGRTFTRWGEAFLRPGLRERGSWTYGDMYQNWGLVETESDLEGAPRELSLYASEGYWRGPASKIRRYSLRLDGFVSVNAPLGGGELVTRPVRFAGDRLSLNLSTSAAGSLRVEIQDAAGRPQPGFGLEDCQEIIGDTLDYPVRWRGDPDLGRLRGQAVRLRFVLRDADLYSFQFAAARR